MAYEGKQYVKALKARHGMTRRGGLINPETDETPLPPPREPFRRFIGFVKPHWRLALTASVLSGARTGLLLLFPLFIKFAIDELLVPGGRPPEEKMALLKMGALPLAGMIVLLLFCHYGRVMATSRLSLRIITDLRAKLYSHVQRLGMRFFEERKIGSIMSRLLEDVNVAQSFVNTAITTMLVDGLYVFGVIGLLFALDWQLALLSMAAVPFVALQMWFFRRHVREAARTAQEQHSVMVGNLFEKLAGHPLVLATGAIQREDVTAFHLLKQTFRARLNQIRWAALFQVGIGFITQCAPLLLVSFAIWRIIKAEQLGLQDPLSVGDLFAFMVYLGLLLGPLGRFAELQNSINTAIAGLERVFQFFDVEPDVPAPTDPVTLPDPVQGGMEIKNVSFQYRADRDWALKNLSLKIEPGEVLALVGPSGHGKSTIVKLLARFYDVNEGEVLLDGVDIRKLAEHDLRSAIGLVSQETVIFSGTVGMNIAYGAPYPIRHVEREAILEAAKMAHAWEFIERLPEGLDTPIGERGVRLSAGQRQRIALARLFLRNPPVLLLDEATSALDSVSEQLVQDALEHLMEGRTSVVVAHRLATIRHAHRIAVIRNGEIAELGNHEELLERRGIYAELHQKQILESPIV